MSGEKRGGTRQADLFPRSKRPTIAIETNHRLVILTDEIDWTELEERVERIRESKLKNAAGRPPRLRALIGALLLKATRDMTWREAEDLIRHYAPARYLCGLTETEWSPDFTTLHDFAVLLGEDGVKLVNEYAVEWAISEKMADPRVVVGDTTAQEAAIPYPNEMGMMAAFLTSLTAASTKAGSVVKEFVAQAKKDFDAARQKVREYRLFANDKSKAVKNQMVGSMASVVEKINRGLGRALEAATVKKNQLTKYGLVAKAKATKLHETMGRLIPQIRYWLRTGFVAKDKIVSLHMPELYSIVRGKIGKSVEFGLNWGFTRLKGGFLLARVAADRRELHDQRFAVKAVEDHIARTGKVPRAFAYDRGGYSPKNVSALKKLGVKQVALAPQGNAKWAVSDSVKDKLVKERALVEAGIGSVKSSRYNFSLKSSSGPTDSAKPVSSATTRSMSSRSAISTTECM